MTNEVPQGGTNEDEVPPPTAPDSIAFSMSGFAKVEDANRIAHKVAAYVRLISSYIDLSRLDGVTVAYDYDEALAELDRGVEGLRTLSRSNDDQLIGVGMAPAVIRDGVVKVHIVLNAPYMEGIDDDASVPISDDFHASLYLLAHECAHVQVTADTDKAFPGRILQHQIASYEEAIFSQVVDICWEEYAACRLSAPFSRGQLGYYEEGLRGVLGVAHTQAASAREAFWEHGDLNRVVAELSPPLALPLRLASYVLGHLDGISTPPALSDETRDAIVKAGYEKLIDDLAAALRTLWDEKDDWHDPSDFDTIGDVARDAFWEGGLVIYPAADNGAQIHVWEPDEVDPDDLGLTKEWHETTSES